MKSKLLQKKSYGANQPREVVDGQQQNHWSSPTKGRETAPDPAVDAEARKAFPGLLKHGYRPARS
jgi:hypothetical protein